MLVATFAKDVASLRIIRDTRTSGSNWRRIWSSRVHAVHGGGHCHLRKKMKMWNKRKERPPSDRVLLLDRRYAGTTQWRTRPPPQQHYSSTRPGTTNPATITTMRKTGVKSVGANTTTLTTIGFFTAPLRHPLLRLRPRIHPRKRIGS